MSVPASIKRVLITGQWWFSDGRPVANRRLKFTPSGYFTAPGDDDGGLDDGVVPSTVYVTLDDQGKIPAGTELLATNDPHASQPWVYMVEERWKGGRSYNIIVDYALDTVNIPDIAPAVPPSELDTLDARIDHKVNQAIEDLEFIEELVEGDNVEIDNTDPKRPVINVIVPPAPPGIRPPRPIDLSGSPSPATLELMDFPENAGTIAGNVLSVDVAASPAIQTVAAGVITGNYIGKRFLTFTLNAPTTDAAAWFVNVSVLTAPEDSRVSVSFNYTGSGLRVEKGISLEYQDASFVSGDSGVFAFDFDAGTATVFTEDKPEGMVVTGVDFSGAILLVASIVGAGAMGFSIDGEMTMDTSGNVPGWFVEPEGWEEYAPFEKTVPASLPPDTVAPTAFYVTHGGPFNGIEYADPDENGNCEGFLVDSLEPLVIIPWGRSAGSGFDPASDKTITGNWKFEEPVTIKGTGAISNFEMGLGAKDGPDTSPVGFVIKNVATGKSYVVGGIPTSQDCQFILVPNTELAWLVTMPSPGVYGTLAALSGLPNIQGSPVFINESRCSFIGDGFGWKQTSVGVFTYAEIKGLTAANFTGIRVHCSDYGVDCIGDGYGFPAISPIVMSATGDTLTGTTSETIMRAFLVPRKLLREKHTLRVAAGFGNTGNNASKIIRISKENNLSFTQVVFGSAATVQAQCADKTVLVTSDATQIAMAGSSTFGTVGSTLTNPNKTIDTSDDYYILMVGALTNTLDTLTLAYSYLSVEN